MNKLTFLRIPFADDKVFGFLLLIFILCTFTIVTVFSEPIDSPRMFIWSVLLGLGIVSWLRQDERKIYLDKSVSFLLVGLVIWAIVATIFSLDVVNSLVGVNIRMTSSLWFFTAWVATICLITTLTWEKLLVLLRIVSFIFGIVSIWAICQFYGLGFYEGLNPSVRTLVPSFLGNPNFAAMFVGAGVFINLWYLFKEKGWFRLTQIFFIACHIFSLMIFTSRGALLGVALATIVLLFGLLLKKQWKALIITVSILSCLAAANLLFFNTIRDGTLIDISTDQSANQRWYAWDNAFSFIAEAPLTGSGLGNYFIVYRQNQESYLSNLNWFDDSHNLLLHLAASGGLPLSILFLLIVCVAIGKLVNRFYYDHDEQNQLPLFLLAALIALLTAAMFNPFSVSNWLLLSLLLALSLKSENYYQLKSRLPKFFAGTLGVVFIILGASFITSELFLWQANGFSQKSQYVVSERLARAAVLFNPTNLVALNQLAMSEYFNNNIEGALLTLQRTEALHPLSAGVYQQTLTGFMNIYQKTGDEKVKRQIYESMDKYRAVYNNHQFIHQNLANLYYQLGDFNNALIEGRRWVVLSQGNYSSWLFMSSLYQVMGEEQLQLKARQEAFLAAPSIELRVK